MVPVRNNLHGSVDLWRNSLFKWINQRLAALQLKLSLMTGHAVKSELTAGILQEDVAPHRTESREND